MAEKKLKQYIAEYFLATEVKNGKAPTRTLKVKAINLKYARSVVSAISDRIILSLKLDKGQGHPGRKAHHKLSQKELNQVATYWETVAEDIKDANAEFANNDPKEKLEQENSKAAVDMFKGSEKVSLETIDAIMQGTEIIGNKRSDKAATTVESIIDQQEASEPCPVCESTEVDEEGICKGCYAEFEKQFEAAKQDDQTCVCGIGIDDNGDGDCAACTSPVYQQAQEVTYEGGELDEPSAEPLTEEADDCDEEEWFYPATPIPVEYKALALLIGLLVLVLLVVHYLR